MRIWGAVLLALWAGSAAVAQSAHVSDARYSEPTDRYGHAVLGDAIEWGALEMTVDGQTVLVRLPQTRVFEDVAPRLVEIEGDGAQEVMVVETLIGQGARLAIYGGDGSLKAATPYIGRNFRWLAPIGAGDFDGDGFVEVAYIDRPHLAKTLRIWRFEAGELRALVDLPGLTNHRIGEADIAGGLRDCGQGIELITADANWRSIMATRFDGRVYQSRVIGPHVDRASFAEALSCAM